MQALTSVGSVSVNILHFHEFVQQHQIDLSNEIKTYLIHFVKRKSSEPGFEQVELLNLFKKYEDFKKETLEGKHGKTAQYYMFYVNLIDYYLLLNTSIRTGNFEIFKFVLPKITNLVFAFNQPNYSRYLVKYHDNLFKVDETHPGLRQQFEKGSFGIKRIIKSFSKQPVDLTLEQTINADAANKLTGISHMTSSISARQRWCRSHTIRSTIISYTLEKTGLTKTQDVTAELQKSRIKRDKAQLRAFIDGVKRNINPFSNNLNKEFLYNISTGEAAPEHVIDFLLNVEEKGNKQRENFIRT